MRSTWDNLEGYGKRKMRSVTYELLILRQPNIERSGWIGASFFLMPTVKAAAPNGGTTSIPITLAKYQDFIPVSMFAHDWRSSELGALVKQYAPQAYRHPSVKKQCSMAYTRMPLIYRLGEQAHRFALSRRACAARLAGAA